MSTSDYMNETWCIFNNSLFFYADPTKHKPELRLSKQPECVTRTSAKRKPNDEIAFASKKQKTSELEHATPSEEESLTDTDFEL